MGKVLLSLYDKLKYFASFKDIAAAAAVVFESM